MISLSEVPTCDLVNELAKREGVEEYVCDPDEEFVAAIVRDDEIIKQRRGPASILVVID